MAVRRRRRGIAIGGALLLLGTPAAGATAAPDNPLTTGAQADDQRADEAQERPRKKPVEPKGNPASPAAMRAGRLSCGDVITKSTTLVADIGPCPADGIIIGADNITLNLNGHTISGTPGVGDGSAAGIRLPNRSGVTVTGLPGASGKKGNVTGFDGGVFINGGSGNTIENLNVRDNVGPAARDAELGDGIVLFKSASNRIVNNVVSNNGHYDGIGVLGLGSSFNVLEGNIVEGTVGIAFDRSLPGSGVIISHFLDQPPRTGDVIHQNKAVGNTVRRNFGTGISNVSNVGGEIIGNVVEDNGLSFFGDFEAAIHRINAHGIGATSGPGVPPGPTGAPDTNMLIRDNKVDHNGLYGIFLRTSANRVETNESFRNGYFGIVLDFDAFRNTITSNTTGYNGLFDLLDANDDCDSNVWFGNTWGPVQPLAEEFGFAYFPDCTTAGGHEAP